MEATTSRKAPIVTYDSVAAAAESLSANNQRPSVRSVIAVLGGGSPNAVLPHLNAWKAARPSVKASDVTIDPRIAAILAEQISATVLDATRAAEAKAADLEADAEAVAEAGRQAEARAEELAAEVVEVKAENQQLTGRVAALADELEQLKKDTADAIAVVRADAQREREAAEQARQALARAELRLEAMPRLEGECRELKDRLQAMNTEREKAVRDLAVSKSRTEALEVQLAEVKRHDEDLIARMDADRRRLEAALSEAQKDVRATAAEVGRLQGEAAALTRGKAEASTTTKPPRATKQASK